jgi:probable rRNA maturation factor
MLEFHFETGTPWSASHLQAHQAWIDAEVHSHQYRIDELAYIFVDDETLFALNQQHLQHDEYTDILTFDYSTTPQRIQGEIYISLDRVADNAQQLGIEPETELRRVMIHGVLHLLGYNDHTDEEEVQMRQLEDKALARWPA